MGSYLFHKDLSVSKQTENTVAQILAEKTQSNIKVLNNNRDYDIMLERKGRNFLIEVKEDFMAAKTGNIAVEYSYRGKPSGIETTKADVYAYVIHDGKRRNLHLVSVKNLKKSIENKNYFRTVSGGDRGSNTKMYLFKKDDFSKIAKKIAEF